MTMQRRPNNPIEKKKQDVRRYTRNGVVTVGGGIAGGLLLAFVMSGSSWFWLSLGLVVAVVGGVYNWSKVNRIVNEKYTDR
ncbi:hypothetical protein [Corynebacterium massiliense]|uniref:Secreted protein n=1 Tax=Corynebacterium massiliense DSM 45435 TaxID=1121364 RepID=A0ABY7U7Z7_9CORY|nr:hypothetical protein [Corynebacterium massiliense]WCZ32824.1 hypothetical protein CMASS_06950 [Corynebacterium massiliense DSM 45435]